MAEITGVIDDIVYRNEVNGFTVIDIIDDNDGSMVTAVGSLPFANAGERVRITGEWTEHPDYGQQLKVQNYETISPSTLAGMERYLSSGLIKGIGPATAKKLVDYFGLDTLDIIQFKPDRLTEVDGIGSAKAEKIASSFAEQKEVREVMLFLQTYGITTNYAVKIYKIYGADTISVVKENPYRLADEITGIGFKTADRIAQSMGMAHDSPNRVAAGVMYVLSKGAGNGHTCLPKSQLVESACLLLGVDVSMVENAIVLLAVNRSIFMEEIEDDTAVYMASFYFAELGVCKRLMKLSMIDMDPIFTDAEEELKKFQKEQEMIFAAQQKKAIVESMSNGVVVITGGPGTGKTTTINCIIKLFEKQGLNVVLAAPTGRAAKRMFETTGHEAKTIHRLLEYGYAEGQDVFNKGEEDPITADAVIVDEMSMVDILLMNHLLKAVVPGTRLILVGDVDQLPSVGPGNVLRDIIESELIKVVRLTDIFRQAQESMIIVNAHRINRGEFPYINVREKDFFFDRREKPQDILDTLKQLVLNRLPKFGGYHPLDDIQILTPMRKGVIGVNNLNIEIQKVLNPPSSNKKEKEYRDIIYRQYDKVMQIKNNYKMEWKRFLGDSVIEEGEGIFNGDVGYITDIDEEEQSVTVVFDHDKEVNYDFSQLDELELAYAISIHKSQGSEFPVAVIPLAWGPPMLMNRNLLYTAVTRAREMVVIVGRERMMESMVENDHISERYSGLKWQFKKFSSLPFMEGGQVLPFDK